MKVIDINILKRAPWPSSEEHQRELEQNKWFGYKKQPFMSENMGGDLVLQRTPEIICRIQLF